MLALLYDVHGNAAALEAVLSDARAQGADRWLLGGDYCLFGPEPEAALERLRALSPAMWLRGNGERWCAAPDALDEGVHPIVPDAVGACREALGAAPVDELGALPEQGVHEDVRYCHASPVSDLRSFLPQPAEDEAELLAGVTEPRLVFGHTHLPFRRISTTGGIELVNPGSVGLPFDGDTRAAYALLHDDGTVEHRRVAYDHRASARRVAERFGHAPWTQMIGRIIEEARFTA
jgi:diadenosine tetraphosphatase ApaH/serine/threonine PP2A family protein phosphatase